MNEAAREAREEAAERELTGTSNHGVRMVDEGSAVQAALERALTSEIPPQRRRTAPVDERMMVSLTENLTDRCPQSGRGSSVLWTAAANGGLRWEGPQQSRKGGQEP